MKPTGKIQLFTADRQRKYLTAEERAAFLEVAKSADPQTRTFALTLAYTGCRISEALALTAVCIDVDQHRITFETLKQRQRGVFRAIPVPAHVTDALDLVHGIRRLQRTPKGQHTKLWTWSRSTGYRHIRKLFVAADITGPQATPKGHRHAFGINGVQKAPLNMVKKWLGHKNIVTTEIYADAVGEEEQQLAAKLWAGE